MLDSGRFAWRGGKLSKGIFVLLNAFVNILSSNDVTVGTLNTKSEKLQVSKSHREMSICTKKRKRVYLHGGSP